MPPSPVVSEYCELVVEADPPVPPAALAVAPASWALVTVLVAVAEPPAGAAGPLVPPPDPPLAVAAP